MSIDDEGPVTSIRSVSTGALKLLAPETRRAIEDVGTREHIPAGTVIIAKGEATNGLVIIQSGTVCTYRASGDEGEEVSIFTLQPWDVVGELSFLDGGPQQLTARAQTDCVVHRIDPQDILERDDGDHLYDNLRASVGITVAERLRTGTEHQVTTLRRQLETARDQRASGLFFLCTLGMMAVGMVFSNIVADHIFNINVYSEEFG